MCGGRCILGCGAYAATRVSAAVIVAGICAVVLLFNAHHDPSEDYTRLRSGKLQRRSSTGFPLLGVGPFNFSRLYALVRSPDGDPTPSTRTASI